jgi:hypothetical protein
LLGHQEPPAALSDHVLTADCADEHGYGRSIRRSPQNTRNTQKPENDVRSGSLVHLWPFCVFCVFRMFRVFRGQPSPGYCRSSSFLVFAIFVPFVAIIQPANLRSCSSRRCLRQSPPA